MNGVFTAAETWKCPECFGVLPPRTQFVVHGADFYCVPCAGIYYDLTRPDRPVRLAPACPPIPDSPAPPAKP